VTGYSFSGIETKFQGFFASIADALRVLEQWSIIIDPSRPPVRRQ
jgi:hypothetical protein